MTTRTKQLIAIVGALCVVILLFLLPTKKESLPTEPPSHSVSDTEDDSKSTFSLLLNKADSLRNLFALESDSSQKMHLAGQITIKEAQELFISSDLAMAKRQLTWFKRNSDINWFDSIVDAKSWLADRI